MGEPPVRRSSRTAGPAELREPLLRPSARRSLHGWKGLDGGTRVRDEMRHQWRVLQRATPGLHATVPTAGRDGRGCGWRVQLRVLDVVLEIFAAVADRAAINKMSRANLMVLTRLASVAPRAAPGHPPPSLRRISRPVPVLPGVLRNTFRPPARVAQTTVVLRRPTSAPGPTDRRAAGPPDAERAARSGGRHPRRDVQRKLRVVGTVNAASIPYSLASAAASAP